jgi:hypothetical protein
MVSRVRNCGLAGRHKVEGNYFQKQGKFAPSIEKTSIVNRGNNSGCTFIGWQKAKVKMRRSRQPFFARIFGWHRGYRMLDWVAVFGWAQTKPEACEGLPVKDSR